MIKAEVPYLQGIKINYSLETVGDELVAQVKESS